MPGARPAFPAPAGRVAIGSTVVASQSGTNFSKALNRHFSFRPPEARKR
ncbi:MAG: hypothetical protein ACK54Z_05890 [Cyanobacteriota bacterium]